MQVALVVPLDEGALTVHRGGEVRLWRLTRSALESRLSEWRSIVGWKRTGGELGGGDPSSIVREHPSPAEATMPKHGKVDPSGAPHVGGNTWAGGTGGRDTAGLGGKGGPYRLSDGNPIFQISDEEKQRVSPKALAAAREMATVAWRKRLQEIDMSEHEAEAYQGLLRPVAREVAQLRQLLASREAKEAERVWLTRQSHGEIDDARLVDGVAGERAVYKRRAERPPEEGSAQLKPKHLSFVMDLSGSMYYFNGHDGRLERGLQSALMLFESLSGFEHKYRYGMWGHSGDTARAPLVELGLPPPDEKARLRVVQRMVAHTQFCGSGDHTLEAAREAIAAAAADAADERFVFLFSDANLERYGIRPSELGEVLLEARRRRVVAHAIFLSSIGGEAERLKAALPAGCASVCLDASEVPKAFKQAFASSVLQED